MGKYVKRVLIITFWLIIWQLVSMLVNNSILIVGPIECIKALIEGITTPVFWKTVAISFGRIAIGFIIGSFAGILMAVISSRSGWFEDLIKPVMSLIKSIPVASFVVLFLIWWGVEWLASVISMLVVLPNMYTNTLEGIKSTDKKILEMSRVFNISTKNSFFYIYRPALKPFIDSSIKVCVGQSWKSGVAAEVISTPAFSIGERLYMSKIYIETADVIAWTVVVIVLSCMCEKVVIQLWNSFSRWQPVCSKTSDRNMLTNEKNTDFAVKVSNLTKSFDSKEIIKGLSQTYEYGNTYYLRGKSGSGKTTFFRLLAGLETPDNGQIEYNPREKGVSYLFQEDRLCEDYSAVKNVALVVGDEDKAREELLCVLEKEDIEKPCSQLSGGMKRRVALVRALYSHKGIVLLDEPFTGMDDSTRKIVEGYIEKRKKGKCIIIATHI